MSVNFFLLCMPFAYCNFSPKMVTFYWLDDQRMIQSFNIDGCRRRRGQPGRGRPRFRCDGNVGPPCTVKRGDKVYLDVDFGSGTQFSQKKSHHLFGEDLVIVAWLAASIATVAFIDGTWNHMVHISTEMLATQVVLIALWKQNSVKLICLDALRLRECLLYCSVCYRFSDAGNETRSVLDHFLGISVALGWFGQNGM